MLFEMILSLGVGVFASDVLLWLLGFWYWLSDRHRADRATYEVIARCACHPHAEGRGASKMEALRKLEVAVTSEDARGRTL